MLSLRRWLRPGASPSLLVHCTAFITAPRTRRIPCRLATSSCTLPPVDESLVLWRLFTAADRESRMTLLSLAPESPLARLAPLLGKMPGLLEVPTSTHGDDFASDTPGAGEWSSGQPLDVFHNCSGGSGWWCSQGGCGCGRELEPRSCCAGETAYLQRT